MSNSVLVFSDLLKLDLYRRDTVEAAVNELETLAYDLNKASIYYAWTVGKFIRNAKLKTQFHTNVDTVAKLMGTTKSTLYRYGTLFDMLTEGEVVKLSTMGCSANAVLALADQYKIRPEEAKVTRDRLLSGELVTAKDVQSDFDQRLLEANRPHQVLPAGEPPESDPSSALQEADDAAKAEAKEAAVPTNAVQNSEDSLDDDDEEGKNDTQQNLDAKACMKSARSMLSEYARYCGWLSDRTEEMFAKLEDLSSVIISNEEFAEEFDEKVQSSCVEMTRTLLVLIKQLSIMADHGILTNQIPMPKPAKEAFDGEGLFVED